jgi:hypothetical protein
LSDEQIRNLNWYAESDLFSPDEKLVLELADAITGYALQGNSRTAGALEATVLHASAGRTWGGNRLGELPGAFK